MIQYLKESLLKGSQLRDNLWLISIKDFGNQWMYFERKKFWKISGKVIIHLGKFGRLLKSKFWDSKNVLVTGHTGFKGSWMCQVLSRLNSNISGISLKTKISRPNLFDLLELRKKLNDHKGDLANKNTCFEVVHETKPDIIIHMAAQAQVKKSYINPVETFRTNVLGTLNILEAARTSNSIKAILVVTSDKCYKNNETKHAYEEDDKLGGNDPYSSSKACAEHIARSFYKSFFMENNIGLGTARSGNVVGGGDWSSDRLIPDIVRSWIKNKPVIIRSPNAVRPWQHVMEPIYGYLKLIEKIWKNPSDYSGGWNFGPDSDNFKNVFNVVELANQFWDNNSKFKIMEDKYFKESKILILNNNKMKRMLNINPKLDIETTLRLTIDWYKKYYNGKNITQAIDQQLNDYETG